jgi:enamine deaminase RidA (YjgF/YER057c/UK114 family)
MKSFIQYWSPATTGRDV